MLQEILENETNHFSEFTRSYPELYKHLDKACEKLIEIGFYLNDELVASTNFPAFGSLLIGINECLVVSALRFVSRDYDEAIMLLRMASELSRDLTVIVKRPELFYLWKRYRTQRSSLIAQDRETFRKVFKFELDTKAGKTAKEIYDHTSEIGVHGARIMTNYFRKLPPQEAISQLKLLMLSMTCLPTHCREGLQPFFDKHSQFISRKFDMPFDEFMLDLELRYASMSVELLIADKMVSELLAESSKK